MKDTRKKSRALKILSGNAGKRKLKPEPKFPPANKKAPYSLDKIGKSELSRIVDELRSSGVLTKMDETILWAYCTQCSIAVQCSQKIQEEGLLIKATPKSKRLTANPHLPIMREALKLMKSFAKELGITPASRSRVTSNPIPADDPYKKMKEQRQARITDIKEKRKQWKALGAAKAKAVKKAIKNAEAKKPDGKTARIASMKAKIKEAAKAKMEKKKNPNDRPTAG